MAGEGGGGASYGDIDKSCRFCLSYDGGALLFYVRKDFVAVFFLPVPQTIPASFDVPRGIHAYSEQEDVNILGHENFLRLNGARNIGIRTSFGVPVVSRWGVTFVIVFYSRTTVQVCSRLEGVLLRAVDRNLLIVRLWETNFLGLIAV